MIENFENAQIPLKFMHRRSKFIHSDSELNNYVKSTILEWSVKDFTCPNAIQNYIYQTIEPHSMKLYFSQCLNNVHAMKTHFDLVQNINSHIWALLCCRPAVTFLDIYKMIETLCGNDKQRLLGPIAKIPIIKSQIFGNMEINFSPPKIRLSDLICDCAQFLTEQISTNKRIDETLIVNAQSEKQFLHFLLKKYHVNDFNLLGVKIVNFTALRDAAYAAKGDSFHKLIVSEKLNKLLKSDVKAAIKNIRERLAATKLFQTDTKPFLDIKDFANMSFEDAIKRFFQPFLDEEEKIFTKHSIKFSNEDEKEDSLSVVRKIKTLLIKDKMHGRLFQMAAIAGALNKCSSEMKRQMNWIDNNVEPWQVLINLDIVEWKSRIFFPLLNDVNSFMRLCLLSVDTGDNNIDLNTTIMRIAEKCRAISHLFSRGKFQSGHEGPISNYKMQCLTNLAHCCQAIIEASSMNNWLKDDNMCAKLHLDLFPQMYHLLVLVLSRSKLSVIEPPKSYDITKNEELVSCVFKAKLSDFIRDNYLKCPQFSLKSVSQLEQIILDVLQLHSWPLDGSFVSFLLNNRDLICRVIEGQNKPELDRSDKDDVSNDKENDQCQSIIMRHEFLHEIMKQLPTSVSIDEFTNQVLPSMYGVMVTDSNRQLIIEMWHNHAYRQNHLHADGLPPAIDIRLQTLPSSNSIGEMEITNAEYVMRIISVVPLLDNVPATIKWNSIYRSCWGDICHFTNEHSQLAASFNVRLIQSEIGIIRANVTTSMVEVDCAIQSMILNRDDQFQQFAKFVIGQCVSIMVKASESSKLELSKIIESISLQMMSANHCLDEFIKFCVAAMSLAPPELSVDIATSLVYPLGRRVFPPEDSNSAIRTVLMLVDRTCLTVLRLHLATDHPLVDIIKDIETASKPTAEVPTVQKSQPPAITRTFPANRVEDVSNTTMDEVDLVNLEIDMDYPNIDQRQVVDDIRLNEFGVGFQLDDSVGNKIVANFNKKMARLVEHLSNDLYANSSHFVLELVQNADDNRYSPNIRPTLELIWRQTEPGLTLVVENNEIGFTESDLRSLCDIGSSTKSEYRTTKIGRKGIGFKSVFLVSDSPEIHSNGFHVKFDRYSVNGDKRVSNNALVPTWTDVPSFIDQRKRTTILLPIIPSLRSHIRESVAFQLKPYLLLFLRNLTRISILTTTNDGVDDDSRQVREQFIELVLDECHKNRKVVTTDDGKKHSWFICSRQIPIIDLHLQQISPRGLSYTELSVAIPTDEEEPQHDLPAFAYLPIRSYGLRFIVNADFVIPASREDIANESAWNKWIIEQLGALFTQSILAYISCDSDDISHRKIIRLIETVPLLGEIPGDSSFHTLVPQLRSNLTHLAWLPDRYNNLHAPCKLIIESIDDSSLTEVLCSRLQLNLLHPEIASCASERVNRVLNWLGCQSLSLSHLSQLLSALTDEDLANKSLMKSIIMAIQNGLERDSSMVTTKRIIIQLKSLPIWPVIGSGQVQLISINQSDLPIFLPPSYWLLSSPSTDSYSLLRRVISPAFIASYEDHSDKKHINVAVSILARLGVHELTSSSMLTHAIIPNIANQSRDWLMSTARFLVDQCHPSQYRENIIPRLSFATVSYNSRGISSPSITRFQQLSKIHLAPSLESPSSIIPLLRNNIDYVTIDDTYVNCSRDEKQWREFFLTSGVSETFYHTNEEDDGDAFPEIRSLLNLNNKSINIDLLRYLDKNWNNFPILRSDALLTILKSNACIPVCTSSAFITEPDQFLDVSSPLKYPSESLFLSSSDPNKILLPDSLLAHFPICPVIFSTISFPQHLKMINNIGVDHIMSFLNKVFVTKTVFLTSKQAVDLYSWIHHNLARVSLVNIFSNLKQSLNGSLLVAVPSEAENDPCELVLDQYCYWSLPISEVSKKHVFLQDQQVNEDLKKLLKANSDNDLGGYRSLVKLFPDFQDLFVDVMQIPQFPTTRNIWNTLEGLLNLVGPDRLNNDLNHSEMELITDVYNVVQFLDHFDNGKHRSDLLHMRLIPCLKGGYRSFDHNTERFLIYSWRSFDTVCNFQEKLADNAPIDFLAINCFLNAKDSHLKYYSSSHVHRWSVAQFLTYYFNLPVLEDEMRFHVNNRDSFVPCKEIKSMVAHLEVIVSQWFQRNVSRDGVAHCTNMLSSITEFCSSDAEILISVSLRNQKDLGYEIVENVHIGPMDNSDTFEMLVGGVDSQKIGLPVLDNVMNALIGWILKGDCFNHLRERFRKFYRSLFDLIESSDRNQVSIFIRSHNLRINPFSIDYIYDKFASHSDVESVIDFALSPGSQEEESFSPLDEHSSSDRSPSMSNGSNRNLKRKIPVSTEAVSSSKHMRVEDVRHDSSDNLSSCVVNETAFKNGDLFIPLNGADKSVEPVSSHSNRTINRKSIGRNSPMSIRMVEQFSNHRLTPLTTCHAKPDKVAQISGRIGEQLAFEKLSISQCLGNWEIIRVDWVNQHEESRLPYDFKLSARKSDSAIAEVIYLEVKATTQPNKVQFDLSPQEVTAAWSFKENYHLLLVFHSGNYPDDNSKFIHIPDTLGQLQDNQCKLLLDVSDLLEQ